jgi:hypothetical protein
MTKTIINDGRGDAQMDEARVAVAHKLIESLPVTMRPALNQQLSAWDSLFAFEQKSVTRFMSGLQTFAPSALEALTQPLRSLEGRMGVAHWNFSESKDTMENASMLARSEFYADWRGEVQRVFAAINAAAHDSTAEIPKPGRLILIVLPESLPVDPVNSWRPWDKRAQAFKINGDARRLSELCIHGRAERPGIMGQFAQQDGRQSADLWMIDAGAHLKEYLAPSEREVASILSYADLMPFRDKFLAGVNTVPKSIEATDQTLASLRQRDWETWWPAELSGQTRLRSFVIDLFLSGNGALIFSNAFVEWAASEALRRARPSVLIARFGFRAKPKPFTGIAIFENQQRISTLPDVDDPQGSATDALILARYIWLAALRYPENKQTCCLCVLEQQNAVYVVAPDGMTLPWGVDHPPTPEEISDWIGRHLST